MSLLPLPPDTASYTFKYSNTNLSTELEGGASRFRADKLGATHRLDCQWTLNLKNYNYLMAFYRTTLGYGALSFTINLIADSGALVTLTAYFVPGTFGLIAQQGNMYVVGASLEVIPDPAATTNDATIIAAGVDA